MSGAVANVVEVAAIVAFIEIVGLAVGIAAFAAACIGATCNFLLSKFWAFKCERPLAVRQAATYAGVALGTATFNAIVIHVCATVLHMPYLVAWLLATVAIFLLWSYPAQALLVFSPASESADTSAS